METVELKSNLHQLIDGIQNPTLLESLYEILSSIMDTKEGALWGELTDDQKQEVLDEYKESEDSENLIPHSQVLRDIK